MSKVVRVWHEGKRVYEASDTVVAVECDGEEIEILGRDGETTFAEDEWDELTLN